MNKYNTEETTVKQAAMQFDTFIKDGGVGTTLFFVFIILVGVNAHSLHYLLGEGIISWILASIGAIGLSLATIVIIRKPVSPWMKYIFPLFDIVLVFLGFRISQDGVFDIPNPMFWMSVFFSLFIGAILLSVGTINFKENIKLEKDDEIKKQYEAELEKLKNQHKEELNQLKSTEIQLKNESEKLGANNIELIQDNKQLNDNIDDTNLAYTELKSTVNDFEQETHVLKSSYDETLKSENNLKKNEIVLKSEITELRNEKINLKENISQMIPSYVIREAIRSKKRINGNRTEQDALIVALADRIKAGETIEVNEYLNVNN